MIDNFPKTNSWRSPISRRAFLKSFGVVSAAAMILPDSPTRAELANAINSQSQIHRSIDQFHEQYLAAESQTMIRQIPDPKPLPVTNRLHSIDRLLDPEPGVYGVMVFDGIGDLRYSRNAELPFISASLYKLLLTADVLGQIEAGRIEGDLELLLSSNYFLPEINGNDSFYGWDSVNTYAPINQALWATICVSSNVGALALLDLTSGATLDTLALLSGMPQTRYFAAPETLPALLKPVGSYPEFEQQLEAMNFVEAAAASWLVNVTSPADMACFLNSLLRGSLVSKQVSDRLLALLSDQQINDRLPALLPPQLSIAHKTGNLDGVVHDVGIIQSEDGPVLVVAMSEAVPDTYRATEVIQQIGKITYDEIIASPVARPSLPRRAGFER